MKASLATSRQMQSWSVGLTAALPDLTLLLLVASVIVGCGGVIASTQIGGGDYGQWLMTSRPYLGLSVPGYRSADAVPPVIPWLLALTQHLEPSPAAAVHLFAAFLLCGLGAAAFAAGATLFRSRLAGVLATVAVLLLTDRFLDLFAFGGLLQAGATVFLLLSVAALFHASLGGRYEWIWWSLGAWCVAVGALTHTATIALSLPTGLVVGVLCSMRAAATWRGRFARLIPLGVAVIVVVTYVLAVWVPGATDLIRNPASLDYRGPNRLVESLSTYPGTLAVMLIGSAALLVGARYELARRRIGAYVILAAWAAIGGGVLCLAILTAVATDYPRFATPLLAPIVIAAAGGIATAVQRASHLLRNRTGRGSAAGWSAVAAIAIVVATASPAVSAFGTNADGYRLPDLASLTQAAEWISRNVPADRAVLTPGREGKWIEGLTGRAALFSSAVRYSFRPQEWKRSFAADALLRSEVSLVNEFIVARLTDGVGPENTPRRVVIAANHGGEFVDLLRTTPSATRLFGPDGRTLALLTDMLGAAPTQTASYGEVGITTRWLTQLRGVSVEYRQTQVLVRDSSTLELRASVRTILPISGFELQLQPTGQPPLVSADVQGRQATLSFAQIGSRQPSLRIVVARGDATLASLPDGSLRLRTTGSEVRLLVTDLTGSPSPTAGLEILWPSELVNKFDIGAVLLRRDATFDARRSRLQKSGFVLSTNFGPYAILVHQ